MCESNAWHRLVLLCKVHLHFNSSYTLPMNIAGRSFRRNTAVSFDIPFTVQEAGGIHPNQGTLWSDVEMVEQVQLCWHSGCSAKGQGGPSAVIYYSTAVGFCGASRILPWLGVKHQQPLPLNIVTNIKTRVDSDQRMCFHCEMPFQSVLRHAYYSTSSKEKGLVSRAYFRT